jgi:hypothetical protein
VQAELAEAAQVAQLEFVAQTGLGEGRLAMPAGSR